MKRVLIALALLLMLSGCSGVIMNAEYSELLDKTAALSAQTATRAEANGLTPDEMTQALILQAQTWQYFVAARDGAK